MLYLLHNCCYRDNTSNTYTHTHSVLKQFCSAYHNTIVSKYCIFKAQTLLPLESCRHAIISAPNDCLLVNVGDWLTQEAFMFSRLTRVDLFNQRLADATFSLFLPINQRKQIERVQIDAIKFERISIHFFSDVFTGVTVVVA